MISKHLIITLRLLIKTDPLTRMLFAHHAMHKNNNKYKNPQNQSAYSLVELLVSIALGVILTAAVIQAYLGTKRVTDTNAGVARIQENARFSLNFLKEDTKNAGYSSCIGRIRNKLGSNLTGDAAEFLSFNNAVVGWDASGTQIGNTFTLTNNTGGAASNWSDGTNGLPTFLSGEVVDGSDVISLRRYETIDVNINASDVLGGTITTAANHGIGDGDVMMVGNCWQAELFQNIGASPTVLTADESSGTPGNRALSTNKWLRAYDSADDLLRYVNTYYYVDMGAGGIPSLYRFETSRPTASITPAEVTANAQELVEGVDSMQVLYGEDIIDSTTGEFDLIPNRYVSADQVINWENVVSIRIGLLMRSPNNAVDLGLVSDYVVLDDIDLTLNNDDRILRYVVNSTVKLRNKGLIRELIPFSCDANTPGCI